MEGFFYPFFEKYSLPLLDFCPPFNEFCKDFKLLRLWKNQL